MEDFDLVNDFFDRRNVGLENDTGLKQCSLAAPEIYRWQLATSMS